MQCFVLLALAVQIIQTYNNNGQGVGISQQSFIPFKSHTPQNNYIPYHYGPIPMQGYNSGKMRSPTLLPRCEQVMTKLEIVVKKSDGYHYPGVLIDYLDRTELRRVRTNSFGVASVMIRGCEVTLAITATPHFQPLQKKVNLELCSEATETVILNLEPKCNFQVFFQNSGGDNPEINENCETFRFDMVSYMYSTARGSSGSGITVGGATAVPLCIHVNAANKHEKLRMMATNAKGGNTRNVLELYHFYEDEKTYDTEKECVYGARIVLPAAITVLDNKNLFFTFYLNAWKKGHWSSESLAFSEFYVFDCNGEELDYLIQSKNNSNLFTAVEKKELFRKEVIGHDLLIGMTLKLCEEGPVELQGNAAFFDCDGEHTSAQIPNYSLAPWTKDEIDDWVPFCLCGGDSKKIMPVKLHTLRSGALPFKNACHFYLVCPCYHKDLKSLCSREDLLEFFCEHYGEAPLCVECDCPRELFFECPEDMD